MEWHSQPLFLWSTVGATHKQVHAITTRKVLFLWTHQRRRHSQPLSFDQQRVLDTSKSATQRVLSLWTRQTGWHSQPLSFDQQWVLRTSKNTIKKNCNVITSAHLCHTMLAVVSAFVSDDKKRIWENCCSCVRTRDWHSQPLPI